MFFSGKRVLVTGGTGFIGSNLITKLTEQQAVICAVDRNLKDKGHYDKIEYNQIDISDKEILKKIVKDFNPEYIVHLAANNSHDESQEVIEDIGKSNIIGTRNLLEATKDIPYKRFIFLSSGESYFGNKAPFKEDMGVKEASTYSKSKIESEKDCRNYVENYKKPITILRASIVYGPGQRGKMLIPSMVEAAVKKEEFKMTSGEQTRDFIFVMDLVEAIIKACMEEKAISQIINIGTGIPIKLLDVANIVRKHIPGFDVKIGAVEYRKNELFEYYFDISKAKSLLGWEPKYSFEEGIRKTIEWAKNQK